MSRTKKESTQIANYISEYLNEYITQYKSVSRHTIKSYKVSLKGYLEYLETLNITPSKLSYECFDSKHIEDWLVYLRDIKNNQPQTINVRLSSLISFLEYIGKQDISHLNIYTQAKNIPQRKTIKTKIKSIEREQLALILSTINQNTKTGRKDLTMFTLMYNTGTRLDEILSLRLKDLHLDVEEPCITVLGKGQKIRTLPILNKTVNLLKRYILENHQYSDLENYLFYSKIKGKNYKLSEQSVEKQLRKWSDLARLKNPEIPTKIHPHQLRHSAATHWLEDGLNIVEVSVLLDHEQLNTSMKYVDVTISQKAHAMETIDNINEEEKKWKKNKLTDLII